MTPAMDPNAEIAPDELGALLGIDTPDVLGLMGEDGPFKAEPSGFLRLRVALGIAVYVFAGMKLLTDPMLAARAACEAATGADMDEDKRLVIAWHHGRATMGWFTDRVPLPEEDETFGSALRMPNVVIPADRMMRDLRAALLSLRERSRGAAH